MSLFKKFKNSKSFSIFTSHSSTNGSNGPRKTFNTTINSNHNTNTLDSTYSSESPSKFEASLTRTLVVYHIDSETEGTFSLTIKVTLFEIIFSFLFIIKKTNLISRLFSFN